MDVATAEPCRMSIFPGSPLISKDHNASAPNFMRQTQPEGGGKMRRGTISLFAVAFFVFAPKQGVESQELSTEGKSLNPHAADPKFTTKKAKAKQRKAAAKEEDGLRPADPSLEQEPNGHGWRGMYGGLNAGAASAFMPEH
jgi:hypothetical protein